MDKNEYNLKLEEIDKCVNQGDYSEAARLADTIDWRRVRNVRTLCMISEIYEADDRYEDSKALLLRAYRRSPVGRAILYRLVEATIHLKQFDEAIEYYSEYIQAAPHDNNKYILKYKIYRGRGASLDEQIDILKEFLDQEYNEKWAYELARLYQQADRMQECLTTCDDLVLWFHSGKYVTKALELKRRYAKLTPKQQEIYDHRFDEPETEPYEEYSDETRFGNEKKMVDTNEETLADAIMSDTQKEIAQAVADTTKQEAEKEIRDMKPVEPVLDTKPEIPVNGAEEAASKQTEEPSAAASAVSEVSEIPSEEAEQTADAAEVQASEHQDVEADDSETTELPLDEPIKDAQTFDNQLHKYNTQDLQTELVKSMREILSGVGNRCDMDEDSEADQLIEDSKNEQSTPIRTSTPALHDAAVHQPEGQTAGRLSIDDILLSMGERGEAMKQALSAAKEAAQTAAPARPGVMSAVDEALLNMGAVSDVTAESAAAGEDEQQDTAGEAVSEEAKENKEGAEEAAAEAASGDEQQAGENRVLLSGEEQQTDADTETVSENEEEQSEVYKKKRRRRRRKKAAQAAGMEEIAAESDEENAVQDEDMNQVQEAGCMTTEERNDQLKQTAGLQEQPAVQTMEEDDIATAKTRRIPIEEIAERHAAFRMNELKKDLQAQHQNDVQASAQEQPAAQEAVQAAETSEEAGTSNDTKKFTKEVTDAVKERPVDWKPQEVYGSRPMLKEYQKGLFEGFLDIQNMEAQIASAIMQAQNKGEDRTSRTGNVLIFGGHGCGKTTIATGIAKAIAQDRGDQFVKLARIYATDLNRKDIAATIAKIAGGTLIIEEAGDLDDNVVDQLTTAMEFRTDGLVIILEDEQRYIHELLMRHPRFTMKFTSQIFIPVFTIDELVRFGEIYAGDQDYVFSEGAAAALYDRIGNVAAQGDAVSITNVLELVDRAIVKANKFFRKLGGGRKRYDQNDCVILLEKDFS